MPTITPRQKIEQVNMFGGQYIKVILEGDTYDDSYEAAKKYCADHDKTFIHPFDDLQVIEGQATLAYEILEQTEEENRFYYRTYWRWRFGFWCFKCF